MGQPQTPRASLPKQLGNFTNTTAGMDLTMRLIQALCMIATVVCHDKPTVVMSSIAVSQLALGRRYLRFLSSYGFFQKVYDLLSGDSAHGGILKMSYLAENTGLALYLILEDTTILHDMNILLVDWYTPVLLEGNKFWFYAICISIARSLWAILIGFPTKTTAQNGDAKVGEKKDTTEQPVSLSSTPHLLERLAIDTCDLALPGSFLGWIPLGDLGVGMAMVVSTVLASREIWVKAQG